MFAHNSEVQQLVLEAENQPADFLFLQLNHGTKTWGEEWFWEKLCAGPPHSQVQKQGAFTFQEMELALPAQEERSSALGFFIMSLHLSIILRCGTIFQVFSVMGNEAEYILLVISTAAE